MDAFIRSLEYNLEGVLILDQKFLFANEVLPSAVIIFVVNSFMAAENFTW